MPVAVIRGENSLAAELDVPVIFGNAKLRQTLEAARLDEARAVALLTQDDMVNIETGIVLREMLGPGASRAQSARRSDRAAAIRSRTGCRGGTTVRIRLRPVHRRIGRPMVHRGGMELQVFGTFSVGQRSFMVGGVRVERVSSLDGLRRADLSTQTRVIAITRADKAVRLQPRRDTRVTAGDTAYLVGPYRELLDTLRKGQRIQQSGVSRSATPG